MRSIYRNWLLASRPWSFAMTAISVSVGSALGAMAGSFSWAGCAVTLVGMITVHAATNLLNDYFDVHTGVDTREVSTAQYRPHPLLEGKLAPAAVYAVAGGLYVLAALLGLYLAATRGWLILGFALVGAAASITYTAPPFKYKYKALGEVSVFLMWGPLMVEGAYFVQRQALSLKAFWVSLPFGVLVTLVLLVNNIRDVDHDQLKGIRTLPMLIGRQRALELYRALVAAAYAGIVCMSVVGPLTFWSLIVLLSLPMAYRLLRQMNGALPTDADARTAQLDTAFGVLLVISLVLEGLN
jgi:1,4-dihydroxy-2-naphthoate octaprenyltransferase